MAELCNCSWALCTFHGTWNVCPPWTRASLLSRNSYVAGVREIRVAMALQTSCMRPENGFDGYWCQMTLKYQVINWYNPVFQLSVTAIFVVWEHATFSFAFEHLPRSSTFHPQLCWPITLCILGRPMRCRQNTVSSSEFFLSTRGRFSRHVVDTPSLTSPTSPASSFTMSTSPRLRGSMSANSSPFTASDSLPPSRRVSLAGSTPSPPIQIYNGSDESDEYDIHNDALNRIRAESRRESSVGLRSWVAAALRYPSL